MIAVLANDRTPPRPKVFFLSALGASASSGGLYRAQALRCGHWDYPGIEGGFEVTPTVLREMKAHFDDGAKGYEVPLNVEHDDERPAGWVKRVELSSDGTALFAFFEITDEAVRRRVEDGSLAYVSSELDFAWFDPEDKREKKVFEGLALTNRPYIKRLAPIERAPIHLSEFRQDDPMAETMTLEQAQAEIARLKALASSGDSSARLTELQAKLADAEAREQLAAARLAEMDLRTKSVQRQLRLSDVRQRLQGLVRKGKVTRPIYERALALTEALLETDGGTVVRLAAKRKLGDEETDKLDVVDQVLDILDDLPASIATDEAELAEDEDDEAKKDDEAELEKAARAAMREDPKLSLHEAYVLAERKIRGGKR